MINDLNPPWIYPRQGEVVTAMQPLRTSLIRVTYDFSAKKWITLKGQPINIYGWIKK